MEPSINRFHERVLYRARLVRCGQPTRAESCRDLAAACLPLYEAERGARRLV